MDDNLAEKFADAVELAEKPRVAKRQTGRSNNPSDSVEMHYRTNLAVPFIDHIIENLDTKFDG